LLEYSRIRRATNCGAAYSRLVTTRKGKKPRIVSTEARTADGSLAPSFVGPHGAVTAREGEQIIARLEKDQKVPSDILKRQIAFEQALSDVPLTLGNKVILLENGAQTYNAMLAALRSAHSSINIQMFIFSDGQVGRTFAEALIDRQRHGVQVNLMYDSFGSHSTPAAFFDRMRQNGIAVVEYRPLNPFAANLA
jgi:cardiolipin synthase